MTIATLENCQKGMYVIRGPDWEFDDQDTCYGGKGYGIVGDRDCDPRGQPTHWVYVMWDGGYENVYCLTKGHLYIVGSTLDEAMEAVKERVALEDARYALEPL